VPGAGLCFSQPPSRYGRHKGHDVCAMQSIDHYQAMRQDPGPLPFLQEALTIAKFEPGIYEVVRTFAPAGEPD
jgi:hypothetical protein